MENTGKEKFLQFKKEFQELAKKYNYKGHTIMIEPASDTQNAEIFHGSAVLCSTYETDPTPTECLGLIKARESFEKGGGAKMKKIAMRLMVEKMFEEEAPQENRVKRIAQSIIDGYEKTLKKNTGEIDEENPIQGILAALFGNR